MKIRSTTYITTKNDINGNPRRAYIINEIDLKDTQPYQYIIDVLDEGYNGKSIVTDNYPDCFFNGYQINVQPSEYNQYIKIGKTKRNGM
jgi:hypothetical protein